MALGLPARPCHGEEADVLGIMDFTDELCIERDGADRLMRPVAVKRPVNVLVTIRALPRAHDRSPIKLKAVVTAVGL